MGYFNIGGNALDLGLGIFANYDRRIIPSDTPLKNLKKTYEIMIEWSNRQT